ncbi:hypothetical protein SSX86_004790 [Deinandra increscens subsp. villosa]|uniref:DDE Tnp4 domain-containing protein n=1 Tax=Deinandra increscens subsp. villosa TaxID=3103831 RepID=A0AAP0H966_9ASTR
MSDEEWVAEGKLDKYVEKLRNAPLICPDLCTKLFEGVVSTGVHCWGPSSTIPHPAEEFSAHDMDEDHCTQMETDAPHASDESSGRSKHHEGQGNSKRVRRNTFDDDLREVGKEIVNVAKMLVESERLNREKEDDVDACMEKLEKMEWGEGDPRYDTALLLFGESADLRKVWLRLKTSSCESWVRNTGRKSHMYTKGEIIAFLLLSWYWLMLARKRKRGIERIRDNDSALTGHAYTQDLLHGSSTQCHEMMRVSREAFVLLCNHFKQRNWLQASRTISAEEKMAMFLHIIGHNERFRVVKRRFQHSTQTVHQCFHEVLVAMMSFAKEIIVPTSSDGTTNISERHQRLKNIFSGAIGALDGTLVHAVLPANQQPCFRGRGKGECYQNVLGICDFDMIFTYVWAGWEGIAHDSRVLKEIASNPTFGFRFPPPGKYYLCDAAYTNTRGFLAPYRNTRYWLADFRRRRALTKEERFNHAHAQLRNVIERAYGVLKARFPILKQMAPYPFPVQRDVVIACFAVHNFIRKYNIQDELFMDFEETTMATPNVQGEGSEGIEWGSEGVEYTTTLRNQIANQLFSSASS